VYVRDLWANCAVEYDFSRIHFEYEVSLRVVHMAWASRHNPYLTSFLRAQILTLPNNLNRL
jgi:hypothetical protein